MAATIQQGVHYRKLESDISARKTQQVLEALNHPGIAKALEQVPIEKISISRLGDKQHPAWYDSHTQSVSINWARKLGVHFGEEFSPGRTWNMSACTRDKVESVRRSLLQETGHHIEASIPGVKDVVAKAWLNPNRNPITRYAGQEPGEYFAESLVVYLVERDAFIGYDPVGGAGYCVDAK
jgi:hypothetical protein